MEQVPSFLHHQVEEYPLKFTLSSQLPSWDKKHGTNYVSYFLWRLWIIIKITNPPHNSICAIEPCIQIFIPLFFQVQFPIWLQPQVHQVTLFESSLCPMLIYIHILLVLYNQQIILEFLENLLILLEPIILLLGPKISLVFP